MNNQYSPTEPNNVAPQIWRRYSPSIEILYFFGWLSAIALLLWCFRIMTADTIWAFVFDAPNVAKDIGTRMLPPNWSAFDQLLQPLWETLNIATLGTILGMLLAIPMAFLAARNTTPSQYGVRPIALFFIVGSRSINTIIWALLLVAILGPGVLAGIIAIALRSIGFIGKLIYEAIEEIDHRPIEALTATGASKLQVICWGILPQIIPALLALGFYRWDINIRESTILGLVGAGGIGIKLEAALSILSWPTVTLILLLILLTVIISEWLTASIRQRII